MTGLVLNTLFAGLGAYLIGSIPFAIIITRLIKGVDVREQGSGHAGATNTMRIAGWLPGILVMLLDIGKGSLVAGVVLQIGVPPITVWFSVAMLVLGHCLPIFAGYRGGMGLAAAGGALLVFWPLGFILGIGLAAAMQLIIRHSARANVATAILLAPLWYVFGASVLQVGAALAASLVIGIRATTDWNRVYKELWFDRSTE